MKVPKLNDIIKPDQLLLLINSMMPWGHVSLESTLGGVQKQTCGILEYSFRSQWMHY